MRARWQVTPAHTFVSRVHPERLRSLRGRHESVCTETGVDLATGRVLVQAVDVVLPGAFPIVVARHYDSSWAHRVGALGGGWTHAFAMELRVEPGRVALRADDGREIEFDTFDRPERVLRASEEIADVRGEFSLRRRNEDAWRVRARHGHQWVFERTPDDAGRARLVAVTDRVGNEIRVGYDTHGRLAEVHNRAERAVRFEYNVTGALAALLTNTAPNGWETVCAYAYGPDGALTSVSSGEGALRARYVWVGSLLVERHDANGFVRHYGYDGIGSDAQCIETWGSRGIHHTRLSYGAPGTAVTWTDALGTKHLAEADVVHGITRLDGTRFEHDAAFRTLASMDAREHVHRIAYDSHGHVEMLWRADGPQVRIRHDAQGNPEQLWDALGGEWAWRHDRVGNLVEARNPVGEHVTFESGHGLLRGVTVPSRGRTELLYTPSQQLEGIVRADGSRVHLEYDARGRLVKIVDPNGFATSLAYGATGHAVRVSTSDGYAREYVRDAMGRVVTLTAPDARSVRWRRMGDGWITGRTEGDGRTTEIRYNARGSLVGVRSEVDDFAWLAYGADGAVIRETGFDRSVRRYTRDDRGHVRAVQLPGKKRIAFAYDRGGRITGVTPSDKRAEHYTWGADGALASARVGEIEVRFERDAVGRVVRDWQGDQWVESRYDAAGSRVEVRSSIGARHVTVRNALGLASAVCVGDPHQAQWRVDLMYDGADREVARAFPAGVRARWERDAAGRPMSHTLDIGRSRVFERAFAWDSNGRPTGIRDSRFGTARHHRDDSGRLIGWTFEGAATQHRELDPIGDPFRTSDGNERAYNLGGRIVRAGTTTFEHDAVGMLVRASDPEGKVWTYDYTTTGLLARVGLPDGQTVEYTYDALGRRVLRTLGHSTLRWVWDGNVVLHELSSDEGLTSWIWLPGSFSLLAKVKNGRYFGAVTDQVGAPLALVDTDGRLMWSGQVNPWGEVQRDASRTRCPWRFEGHYQDDEALLQFARYRPYSPLLGRYLTPNPLGLHGGTNPYRFVDDPVWQRDPWGLLEAGTSSGNTASHDRLVPYAQFAIDRVRGNLAAALARVDDPAPDALVRRWLPTLNVGRPDIFDASQRPVGWQSFDRELVSLPEVMRAGAGGQE